MKMGQITGFALIHGEQAGEKMDTSVLSLEIQELVEQRMAAYLKLFQSHIEIGGTNSFTGSLDGESYNQLSSALINLLINFLCFNSHY